MLQYQLHICPLIPKESLPVPQWCLQAVLHSIRFVDVVCSPSTEYGCDALLSKGPCKPPPLHFQLLRWCSLPQGAMESHHPGSSRTGMMTLVLKVFTPPGGPGKETRNPLSSRAEYCFFRNEAEDIIAGGKWEELPRWNNSAYLAVTSRDHDRDCSILNMCVQWGRNFFVWLSFATGRHSN